MFNLNWMDPRVSSLPVANNLISQSDCDALPLLSKIIWSFDDLTGLITNSKASMGLALLVYQSSLRILCGSLFNRYEKNSSFVSTKETFPAAPFTPPISADISFVIMDGLCSSVDPPNS